MFHGSRPPELTIHVAAYVGRADSASRVIRSLVQKGLAMLAATQRRTFEIWPRMLVILLSGGSLASMVVMLKGSTPAQLNSFAPFGLCAGLNVFCGMAVAIGSLVIVAAVHLLDLPHWQQIRRVSLILALSGYVVTVLAMLSGLPLPHRAWPAVIQAWQPSSFVYGAVWTLVLLSAAMLLEFASVRSSATASRRWVLITRYLQLPLIIMGLIALAVQQFGLTRSIALADSRMSPFWAGPDVALMFFVSSVCGALALLLFVLWRGNAAVQRRAPIAMMSHIARVLGIVAFVYVTVRLGSLTERGLAPIIFAVSKDSALLLLEVGAFVLGMMWVVSGDTNLQRIQVGAIMIMCGVMVNRLNTSITGLEPTFGPYRPHWEEVLITFSLVAVGVAGFALCAKHLAVFAGETNS